MADALKGRTISWFEPTAHALLELTTLPEGWNSYRARRIDWHAIATALSLLVDTMQPNTPAPSVVPTPPGGVQLEWHRQGIDLEVEVTPQLRILGFYEDEVDAREWETDLTADRTPLVQALEELARRG